MKYHFNFQNRSGDTITEYDTDSEPPRVGDYVQLHIITDDKDENEYRVTEIYYAPVSAAKTNIFIVVEKTISIGDA